MDIVSTVFSLGATALVKSMTGFGQGEAASARLSIRVEIKSVNHRFLDLALRIPKQYYLLEESLRSALQKKISRGRLEIFVYVEDFSQNGRIVKINQAVLHGYLAAFRDIQKELEIEEPLTLQHVLALPDVFELDEPEIEWESLEEVFLEAVALALEELEQTRAAEGARLGQDLAEKLESVAALLGQVAALAPTVVDDYRDRLRDRLADLLESSGISEERFLAEVAIFAEKCCIDEEVVRLRSHLAQFRRELAGEGAVGRKLEFILQEMNREVNTIGSKANNTVIASLVVNIKSELEKMREQVQNIE